jgi:hypothetical protein
MSALLLISPPFSTVTPSDSSIETMQSFCKQMFPEPNVEGEENEVLISGRLVSISIRALDLITSNQDLHVSGDGCSTAKESERGT